MQRRRYLPHNSLHPHPKILRQRRQESLQIFPAKPPSNRHQNLQTVLLTWEAVWVVEEVGQLALLLLQHLIEINCGGGADRIWSREARGAQGNGGAYDGQVKEHWQLAAPLQPQRVELVHGDLPGWISRIVIFNFISHLTPYLLLFHLQPLPTHLPSTACFPRWAQL